MEPDGESNYTPEEKATYQNIKEYIELLSEDAKPSVKFWKLDERIKEDRKKTGVILEMKRSALLYNIISLINDGAITFDYLEGFSDELKETVSAFAKNF